MLSGMQMSNWVGLACGAACLGGALLFLQPEALAQSCTTQAKMTASQRTSVGAAAFRVAEDVLKGDTAAVRALTIPQFAANFGATADLVQSTSAQIAGDSLAVTQAYLLDAANRSTSDRNDAEFNCQLGAAAAETDFAIEGLPPGRYAFVVVEATGAKPWGLSLLLQATDAGAWQMAGFYPHTREAAGHDGLWYWTQARAEAKSGQAWLAYLQFGEADQLLRPANFLSSTNLDRLRSERRAAAPPAIGEGVSDTHPMNLQGANGTVYRVTGLNSEASSDARQVNLVLHLRVDAMGDDAAATARNLGAATALLNAHPELRSHFSNMWVIAEASGSNPVVTVRPMSEVPSSQ